MTVLRQDLKRQTFGQRASFSWSWGKSLCSPISARAGYSEWEPRTALGTCVRPDCGFRDYTAVALRIAQGLLVAPLLPGQNTLRPSRSDRHTGRWARMDDRGNPRLDHIVSFGPFRLFATERLLMKGDESVLLGGRALDILIALIEQAGEVLTRKALISRVWSDVTVEKANLRVHVSALRKALGDGHDGARFVVNVPGQGYCFVARVTRVTAERLLPPVEAAVSHVPKNLPARLTRMVDFLRCRSRMREHVPATVRRWQHMRKTAIVLAVLATA
jgi:DNA-binding winged helix-turn-helix (wHTH) protein